jgi:hypothetical protein
MDKLFGNYRSGSGAISIWQDPDPLQNIVQQTNKELIPKGKVLILQKNTWNILALIWIYMN